MNFSDYDSLAECIEKKLGGLWVTQMSALRDLSGKKRLGSDVLKDIASQLKQRNLKFHPDPLPDSQEKHVIIYCEKTTGGMLVSSVLNPQATSCALPIFVSAFENLKKDAKSQP